jgi:hypothetical protein
MILLFLLLQSWKEPLMERGFAPSLIAGNRLDRIERHGGSGSRWIQIPRSIGQYVRISTADTAATADQQHPT